jgi:hypothetical protein
MSCCPWSVKFWRVLCLLLLESWSGQDDLAAKLGIELGGRWTERRLSGGVNLTSVRNEVSANCDSGLCDFYPRSVWLTEEEVVIKGQRWVSSLGPSAIRGREYIRYFSRSKLKPWVPT